MTATRAVALSALLSAVIASAAGGQGVLLLRQAVQGTESNQQVRAWWVSAAGGLFQDSETDASVSSVGLHGQRDRIVIGLRRVERQAVTDHIVATGVLLGVAMRLPVPSVVFSAGLSDVDVRTVPSGTLIHHHTPGLMLSADVALRAGRRWGAGLGLTGFGNINPNRSFAGIGLEISAGKWR